MGECLVYSIKVFLFEPNDPNPSRAGETWYGRKVGSGGTYIRGWGAPHSLEDLTVLYLRASRFLPLSHQVWVITKHCQMVTLS